MERWILTKGSVRIHVGHTWGTCRAQVLLLFSPNGSRKTVTTKGKCRLKVYLIDRLSCLIGRMP
jgi:hypothetical protein